MLYDVCMSTRTQSRSTRITVSLPRARVEEAERAVAEGRASSVSAYVAQAMEDKGRRSTLQQVLDETYADDPLTEDEIAWGEAVLRGENPPFPERSA